VDNPSLRRYFSSLLARSITNLQAHWLQCTSGGIIIFHTGFYNPSLVLNEILARAISLVLVLLNKYEDLGVYGSSHPASTYITDLLKQ